MSSQLYLFQLSAAVIFFLSSFSKASIMLENLANIQKMKMGSSISFDIRNCWMQGLKSANFQAGAKTCLNPTYASAFSQAFQNSGHTAAIITRVCANDGDIKPEEQNCLSSTYLDFVHNAQVIMIDAYPNIVEPPTPISDGAWLKFKACLPGHPEKHLQDLRIALAESNANFLKGINPNLCNSITKAAESMAKASQ